MKPKIEVEDIENNVYYKMNPQYFMEILDIVNRIPYHGKFIKQHRQYLYNFVMINTSFLDVQNNVRFTSRLFCIFHSITSIPKCKTCNENLINMRDIRFADNMIPSFCSRRCQVLDKDVQNKMQETMLERIGVRHALQNKQICDTAKRHRHETNLDRYGVEEAFAAKCVQEKKEQTNLDRYGVKCTFQTEFVKEKTKQTCLKNYGVDHHMKNKDVYAKSRKTCKDLYGDEHPIRTQPVKDKLNQTNRELYGVDWTFQSENNKEKSKLKCQEKYGTDYALQADEVKQKCKQTIQNNYGVSHNSQIPEVRSAMHKKYTYNEVQFDSAIELCFYIWLVDHDIEFTYQPSTHFKYEYAGVERYYCPDFQIGDKFYEIKGNQFFVDKDPTKEMICPYDHSQDGLYEAKHQCMLRNGVVIIATSDYQKYYDYVSQTYGKDYWKKFKNQN